MNLRAIANKLQLALCQQGRYFKINQFQSYSLRKERMVTKFVLIETKEIEGKRNNVTVMETYSLVDIVKELARIYGGG